MNVYLDWAATSASDPEIIEKTALKSLEIYGNPSSGHSEGLKSKQLLEESRKTCAEALTVSAKNIVFTSGGTESNNIALLSLLRKKKRGKIIISAIEHPSISEPCKILKDAGFTIIKINPDTDGIVKTESVIKQLDSDVQMVSLMLVNNETGAIQPVSETARLVKQFAVSKSIKIHFHCDAVQGTGKIRFKASDKNIDTFSISGHKFSGPRGVGILIVNSSIMPIISGGGQESGTRPGTENVSGIFGISLALEKSYSLFAEREENSRKLLSILFDRLSKMKGAEIIPLKRNPDDKNYSPYILNISFPSVPAEVLTRVLSDKGFYISAGSACSSINKKHSDTLTAMKINNKKAFSAIRVSTGYTTSEKDIELFCDTLAEETGKLISLSR